MALTEFLSSIRERGAVIVPAPPAPDQRLDDPTAVAVLQQLDAAARLDIAGDAPPLHLPTAHWAAAILYRACQFLAHRDVDANAVKQGLTIPPPAKPSPDVCYSADLLLRHLPDVWSLAKGIASEDPLIDSLLLLARQWPLSSVGIPLTGHLDVSPFMHYPSLRRLYADRIIARNDVTRLTHPQVRDAVSEALGDYPNLSPALAAALARNDSPTENAPT